MNRKLSRREFANRTMAVATGWSAALGLNSVARAEEVKWANLVGRIVYDGPPPERKKLKVDKDIECCGKFDIRDESLIVSPDRGLSNVFLYVRSRVSEICPDLVAAVPKRVTLDNKDCLFKPRCLRIWYTKQEFYTINSDPVAQNIAMSPPGDTPVNVVIPVKGDATHKFSRRQMIPIPIACNYHPWESGYILVRDDPYAAITAEDGTFCIPKLPVGPLELQVWHERVGYLDTPQWPKGRLKLTIQPGSNDLGTIKIQPASLNKK